MLDVIVSQLEEIHVGGELFFEALDAALDDCQVFSSIYDMFKDPHRYTLVLTGQFGQRYLNWLNRTSKPYNGYIVFPGGMRDGQQKQHQYCLLKDQNNWMHGKVAFVDDSIYSGTTRETCLARLAVPKDIETYVAYDGMVQQQPWCRSLYRYFDHHDLQGNLIG
jgi:hypothetical protein